MHKNAGKKANQSSNQGPPGSPPYALTTQPMPLLLILVLYNYFCFINGFLNLIRPVVDIVKNNQIYTNEIPEDSMSALLEV